MENEKDCISKISDEKLKEIIAETIIKYLEENNILYKLTKEGKIVLC